MQLDHSSSQMQSFVDSWMSNESRFDVDLSLPVKQILKDVVVVKKSVMEEGWNEEVDGGGEGKEEWELENGVDGHIVAPIWGSTYGIGAISVTNLSLFRPKTLRKSRSAETSEERDARGLEVRGERRGLARGATA